MLECDVVPVGPFQMPGAGRDGVLRRDGSVLERLMHLGDEPVTVRAWVAGGGVRVCAEAATRELAKEGVERMRFALGTDHDLRPFQQAFKRDPLLGPVIRRMPWLRPQRRPEPFEALAWAVCEQLIDGGRAVEIERRLVARHGRRSACGSLRDVPSAGVVGGLSPAQVEACGLSPRRSVTLVRAAREVASGRADLARTSPRGGVSEPYRESARGRSSHSPSTDRAATTSCRPGISPTSSSSGALRDWGAGPRRGRCAPSSSPTRRSPPWRAPIWSMRPY